VTFVGVKQTYSFSANRKGVISRYCYKRMSSSPNSFGNTFLNDVIINETDSNVMKTIGAKIRKLMYCSSSMKVFHKVICSELCAVLKNEKSSNQSVNTA